MISWIQNHILLELTRHKTRRYSELRPRDVEGNLFTYHLKELMKECFVEKHETAYRLTPTGMQFVARLSLKTGKPRVQPKLLTAVIAKNEAGEYLFIKWRRQPNIDLVSFPYGLVHFGESIATMAALELAEKAGLEADLQYKGDIYVKGMRGNEVNRHMLVHLFEANNVHPGRQNELRPDVCGCFWARIEDIPAEHFVPGFYEIAKMANNIEHPIFQEVTTELKK